MPPPNARILSFAALLLILSAASTIPLSLGTATYSPGVQVGDWWKYGNINVQCGFYCPPELQQLRDVKWINSTVTEISGDNVTIENHVTFTNGTTAAASLVGNVETGGGNLTYPPIYFLIAGSLTKGDPISSSPIAPTINDTLTMNVAGLPRAVNLLVLLNSIYTLQQHWDLETGVLFQASFTSYLGIYGAIYLTDSIWHHAPDFSVFFSSTNVALRPSEVRSLSVTVASRNDFGGSVDLSIPSPPAGLVLGLDPSTVNVQPLGSTNSILTITVLQQASPGARLVRLTASNQTISHSTFLTITVRTGDFTLAANPQQIAMQPNANATSAITVTGVDNFAGEVHLNAIELTESSNYQSVINDPSGPRPFLDPNDVTLTENGRVTATLRVQAPNLPISGNFTIKITATSGALSHSLTVTVTIAPPAEPDTPSGPESPDTILGLSPFQFYSTTGVTLAVVATAATLLVFSRRRKVSAPRTDTSM